MIVKNEVKVLPRLFGSLKDYIDYYVIVDTGSTDETKGNFGILKQMMKQVGANTVIDFGDGDVLTLRSFKASTLSEDNVWFF